MEKRYQVFISSTFQDLQEERQEVMQALLELDCIPAGMELFPAANEDQWTLIKKVIDDCDYYLVIIGGRYGSIGPDGYSYTEMEYRYALEKGKPIIAFIHKDPGQLPANRSEEDTVGKDKLKAFRELVQKKVVKYWTTPTDLGSVVSRSLVWLIKNSPAIGWVKADNIPDESSTQEILRLRKQIEELEAKLKATSTLAPEGTDDLAKGEDEFEINYDFRAGIKQYTTSNDVFASTKFSSTWNNIFSVISPIMIDEADEITFRDCIDKYIRDSQKEELNKIPEINGLNFHYFRITESDFQTIKIQLRALGLITRSSKTRSVKDTATYWTITPYGDNVMTRLRAIRKK